MWAQRDLLVRKATSIALRGGMLLPRVPSPTVYSVAFWGTIIHHLPRAVNMREAHREHER